MTNEEIYELEREVFPHYCKNGEIRCADPYNSHLNDTYANYLPVLSISRINGDKFRQKFCFNIRLLKELKSKDYPEGYQVLCENCQAKKQVKQWNRMSW